MTSNNVLILGATSDIAQALAVRFCMNKYSVTLAARDRGRLEIIAADLRIRYGVQIHTATFDALNFSSHREFYEGLPVKPGISICVFGFLGDQTKALSNWDDCARIIDSNYTGAVSILNIIGDDYERKQAGTIVGISSVAGDRGRQSNYLYGSAKAGFTAYLSGMRNRLYRNNVHVLTVKPGFMKTRMIEGMKTPAPLTASPDVAALRIFKAALAKKNVVYVLPVWRLIMFIICAIPEGIFKKLKL